MLAGSGQVGGLGECSIASDSIGLFEFNPCGYADQAGSKVCDSHLIAYRSEAVVRCLFNFSVPETREVLFNGLPTFESIFELLAVSGNP